MSKTHHVYFLSLIGFDPAAAELEGEFPVDKGELRLFYWRGVFGGLLSCPLNVQCYAVIELLIFSLFEVVVTNGNPEVSFLLFFVSFQIFNKLLIIRFIIVLACVYAGKSSD